MNIKFHFYFIFQQEIQQAAEFLEIPHLSAELSNSKQQSSISQHEGVHSYSSVNN